MLGSLVGLALAFGVSSPSEPAVSWEAPSGCPEATAVRTRIEDLLRRPLATDEVQVEAVVRAEAGSFVLSLRVRTGEVIDERELRAERCEALADTAALVAAVMVDPDVVDALRVPEPEVPEPEPEPEPEAKTEPEAEAEAKTEPEPEPEPPPPPEPELPPKAPPSPPPEPTAARRPIAPGLWLRARVGGELGAIPGGTGGLAVAVALGGPRVRGELEGQYWIGRETSLASASARIHLGHVTARACGLLPARPLAAVLCGGLELGAMRADALTPSPLTRHRPWLAAQAEVGLRWQLRPRVALWIAAQPFVPLVFPRFEVLDLAAPDLPQLVHAPTPVGIRGVVGVELRAWPQ